MLSESTDAVMRDGTRIELDDVCSLLHVPGWGAEWRRDLFDLLCANPQLTQERCARGLQPRLTAWYGLELRAAENYRHVHPGRAWPPLLDAVRTALPVVDGSVPNSALVNVYRDGRDRPIPDDEPF